jgi:hypothetical protein
MQVEGRVLGQAVRELSTHLFRELDIDESKIAVGALDNPLQ